MIYLKNISILILVFLMGTLAANAQVEINFPKKSKDELSKMRSNKSVDLSGLWEGKVSQLNWIGQPEFKRAKGKFHVEIEHKGKNVTGMLVCRVKFADNKGYLSYDKYFKGTWDGNILSYEDTHVENYINTHRDLRHLETCLKTAELEFYKSDGMFHLEGDWQGTGHFSEITCTPGKIKLSKVHEEDFALEEAQTVNVNFSQKDNGPVDIKWQDDRVKKIKNRKVKFGKQIDVKRDYLSITVYDHQKDDGDIVSLNYNGNWVLNKYEIDNEEHKVDVFLNKDEKIPNYLILYAHNLGKHPPNTVAVIVDDGHSRQQFILNADMHTSDVIYFNYKEN